MWPLTGASEAPLLQWNRGGIIDERQVQRAWRWWSSSRQANGCRKRTGEEL